MTNIYDIKTLTASFIKENNGKLVEPLYGKHGQVGSVIESNSKYYYLFYKKEWFISFSKFFPKFKGVGIGTSVKFIKKAVENDGIIVFYIKDKEYQISANLMMDFVKKNATIKYFNEDDDMIGNIAASFLERNIISKKKVDIQGKLLQ